MKKLFNCYGVTPKRTDNFHFDFTLNPFGQHYYYRHHYYFDFAYEVEFYEIPRYVVKKDDKNYT